MHEVPKKGTKRDIPGWEKVEEQRQEIVEREQHGESQEGSPDQDEDDRDEQSKLRTVPAHSSRHRTQAQGPQSKKNPCRKARR